MRARAVHRRGRRGPRAVRSIAALALSLAGLVLAAAFVSITVQANALEHEKSAYRADIAAAEADQARWVAHIAEQQTPDYVREKARDYGYIGANESLIAVEKNGQTSGLSAQAVSSGVSRFARWVTFFFGTR